MAFAPLALQADHHKEAMSRFNEAKAKLAQAVEKRMKQLQKKVEAGELPEKEAKLEAGELMTELKLDEVEAALDAGVINEEEAEKKSILIKEEWEKKMEMVERGHDGKELGNAQQLVGEVKSGIEAAVALGTISKERGEELWMQFEEEAEAAIKRRHLLDRIERGVDAARELGVLNGEEAEEIWMELSGEEDDE